MESLWGFTNNNLQRDVKNTPHGILKEQIEHFEKNTNDVLVGRMRYIKITRRDCEYPLATSFEIVAPSLDSYTYKLFTMYCKPEVDFPVLIFVRQAEEVLDITDFNADFQCQNAEEFIDALRKVIGSDDTTRIVQTLYSKCNL